MNLQINKALKVLVSERLQYVDDRIKYAHWLKTKTVKIANGGHMDRLQWIKEAKDYKLLLETILNDLQKNRGD